MASRLVQDRGLSVDRSLLFVSRPGLPILLADWPAGLP